MFPFFCFHGAGNSMAGGWETIDPKGLEIWWPRRDALYLQVGTACLFRSHQKGRGD